MRERGEAGMLGMQRVSDSTGLASRAKQRAFGCVRVGEHEGGMAVPKALLRRQQSVILSMLQSAILVWLHLLLLLWSRLPF